MIKMRNLTRAVVLSAFMAASAGAVAANWWPIVANETMPDGSIKQIEYVPLEKASQAWPICISYPHLKDPFFLAANYGSVNEAKRLGVKIQTLDAGGYTQLNAQISQIEDCVAGGAKAVIMVGVAADGMGNLLRSLAQKNVVVIDAVNGVKSDDVAARVLTNPREEAYNTGKYLAEKHPAGSPKVRVGWLPGPAGAGFVEAFSAGFHEGIKGSAVEIVETKYGDVGKEVQARLVEDMIQTHKDLDYIVGTAVMAEAAVPLLKSRRLDDKIKLVSVYTTPGVYQHLKRGSIEAAGVAPVVDTASLALDMAVRMLEAKEKQPIRVINTTSKVYTKDTIGNVDISGTLAPADFRPVFSYDGK